MLKRLIIPIALIIAVQLDTVWLNAININSARPDMVLAVIVSVGVLRGFYAGAGLGLGMGLFMDVVFGRSIGMYAMTYMIAGAAGGLFYQKFYADNVIIPAAVAAVCAFLKENVMALFVIALGGRFEFSELLINYTLLSVVLTSGVCALVHLLLKPALERQVKAGAKQPEYR